MRTLFFIICSFLLNVSTFASEVKIGFINSDQVVSSISIYKNSIKTLANKFEPQKQELLDLFNHIELVRSNIDLIKKSDSSKTLESELLKLSNLEMSFKKETEFWQKTMNNQKIDLLKEIEILVNQTINEYAIRESYDLIVYDNVAFVSDKIDITQEIILEIEKL